MALSATLCQLLRSVPLPRGGTLLEIGEANWYGDVDPAEFGITPQGTLFDVAKQFYAATFVPEKVVSVDANGSENALRLDLNEPIDLGEQFDVAINHGTAEHVFNIAQVLRTMHDHCQPGGLMIHDAPFTGWIDHGFYCLHPTLFFDLAHVNCYEVTLAAIHDIASRSIIRIEGREHVPRLVDGNQIPPNAMLFVALRRFGNRPFRMPAQGYYANRLSPAAFHAWSHQR